MDKDKYQEVEKALGQPFAADFTENVRKIRMNLMIVSFISLVIFYAKINIESDSTFFGLKFKGINDNLITVILVILLIYNLVHFIWCAIDNILEWWLRLTGTRVAFITGFKWDNKYKDSPNDPRQSTLYTWWLNNSFHIPNLEIEFRNLQQKTQEYVDKLEGLDEINPNQRISVNSSVQDLINKLKQLDGSFEKLKEIISSERITVSLKRFDNIFYFFLKNQNIRWIVFEIGLPILLGIWGVVCLIVKFKQ